VGASATSTLVPKSGRASIVPALGRSTTSTLLVVGGIPALPWLIFTTELRADVVLQTELPPPTVIDTVLA
jgi:hypothetical protein